MCFTNELTTILLMLLTFLLTTMPPTTTTTTAASAFDLTAQHQHQGAAHQQPQEQKLNPEQQQSATHTVKSLVLVGKPAMEVISPGTQLLPHDDNFIASLYNSGSYSHSRSHNHDMLGQSHSHSPLSFGGGSLAMDYNSVDEQGGQMTVETTTLPPPTFDFGMPRNITARAGQPVTINCRVEHLGDKSVSWIRKRDLHILTAGIITYTSDERFKVIRTADSKDWTLHVKYAQPRDSGIYECQVNTEPKISMAFRLNVIVTPPDAKAIITGPPDLYVKVGSAITLTCRVKQPSSAQDIGPIYWYRGPYILTPFVAHPNEAAIDLQRISMESKLAEQLQSRLRIANAHVADSGNYTCMPTTAEAASVMVNVINDESPAAMQKSASSRLVSRSTFDGTSRLSFSLLISLALSPLMHITRKQHISQPLSLS